MIQKTFVEIPHIEDVDTLTRYPLGYFQPDKGAKFLFKEFCNKFKIQYEFGKYHQEKEPDMVLKVNYHFFIIEAKHIKEAGGAQDKQIAELIEFIRYSEENKTLH